MIYIKRVNLNEQQEVNDDIKIKLSYVTKRFDMFAQKSDKIKDFLSFRKKETPKLWALRGISFQLKTGESLGIIGVNGSGKSTLSNIIAGVLPPTTGKVDINGEISIISISSGLKNELTGIDNIRLKLLMSGYKNTEIESVMEDIISFSELGEQINQPIKNYSSGMKARLGFSIMVHLNPDIMIVDEALAVGDASFKKKCEKKITEFKKQGKTFVLVSHNMSEIKRLCEKTAWIDHGELKRFDDTIKVLDDYQKSVKQYNGLAEEQRNEIEAQKREERMNFDINDYFDSVTSTVDVDAKTKLSQHFFDMTMDRMSKLTLLINISLLFLMVYLIIREVS